MSRLRSRLASSFGPRQSRVVSVRSRGSAAGGGGIPAGLMQALLQQQQGFNQGADARFAQVNKMADKTRRRALKANKKALRRAASIGEAQKTALNQQGIQQQAQSQQSLASRGLGNTTIVEQQQRAINQDIDRRRAEIDEDIAGRQSALLSQRAGLEQSLGTLGIDTFLSRRDQLPGLSQQTLALLAQLGGG